MSLATSKSKLKANKKYLANLYRPKINLHRINDSDVIDAIDNDSEPLSTLVKRLLRKHYKLD